MLKLEYCRWKSLLYEAKSLKIYLFSECQKIAISHIEKYMKKYYIKKFQEAKSLMK